MRITIAVVVLLFAIAGALPVDDHMHNGDRVVTTENIEEAKWVFDPWNRRRRTARRPPPPTKPPTASHQPICDASLKPRKYEMKGPGCPIAKWFKDVPTSFGQWEKLLLDKFTGAWRKSGHTPSADENDHNYNTFLGQGNTLGFVAGTLEIDPSALDEEVSTGWFSKKRTYSKYKTGLFATNARYNAVGRFSDFGPDGSVQLGRLALKLAYDPSLPQFAGDAALPWAGEMNLLLTETLETFPLGGFDALAVFASDKSKGAAAKLLTLYQGAKSMLGSLVSVLSEFRWGDILGKTYFSQLPYRLVGTDGTEAAFRFRLRPLKVARDSGVGRKKEDVVKYVRKMFRSRDVAYALEVTINDDAAKRKTVETDVAQDWGKPWVRVGTLTLPAQMLNERGMAEALHRSLAKAVHPTDAASAALDKLFFFHPVMTSAMHRGIGEIQSFRAEFYSQHAAARFATYLDVPEFKPTTAHQQQPPYPKFPFCAIDAKAVGWAASPPKC